MTIAALAALYSCEALPMEPEDIWPGDTEVPVPSTDSLAVCTFNISSADRTKSTVSPDENLINDINIYAYRDGKLVEHIFKTNPTTVTFELNKGYTYNFYAISNMGEVDMPFNESQVGSNVNLWIATIDDLEECIPMAWKTTGVSITGSQKAINVK